MIRLLAMTLLGILAALPFTVLPLPLLAWLAVPAFLVGGVGVLARSVPIATTGAAVATIEYGAALLIAQPPTDAVTPTAFGTALVLLVVLVSFADHAHGAAVARGVLRGQSRQWLALVAVGAGVALGITVCGTALRLVLPGAPAAGVVVAALGALLAVAGAITVVTRGE